MLTTSPLSMLPIHALVQFEAAARHLSFSRAAAELNLTQSAISHGIKHLEAALEVKLFLRKHRALELTAAGQRLFQTLETSLSSISDTITEITRAPDTATELTIACSTSMNQFWLLSRLRLLQDEFPDVSFRLLSLDRQAELPDGTCDLLLQVRAQDSPGDNMIEMWAEEIYAVASPAYLDQAAPITCPADLTRHQLISYEDSFLHRLSWSEWLRLQGVTDTPAQSSIRLTEYAVSLQTAIDGHGIALGWRPSIDDQIESGRLALAYPEPVLTGRHFYLERPKSRAKRQLIEQVCERLLALRAHRPALLDPPAPHAGLSPDPQSATASR